MKNHSKKKTLDRALSLLGLCSRSEAQRWIREGRVKLEGIVVLDPETWIVPGNATIEVDGDVAKPEHLEYLCLHKPRSVVTTRSDPEGRRTVYDVLGDRSRWVAPVGRLDADTSGLLLFTNDSHWAETVSNPSSEKPKVYRVKTRGSFDEKSLAALIQGVALSDGPAKALDVKVLTTGKAFTLLEVTLTEGRTRQVRRMLSAVGSKVQDLKRIRIGPVELGDLPSGDWRHLTLEEIKSLVSSG